MGDVRNLHAENDDAPLFEQFADRCLSSAKDQGLPGVDVARALLATAITEMIGEDGPEATARFLAALAVRLSPEEFAQHG